MQDRHVGGGHIVLTPAVWRLVNGVNSLVNRIVTPVTDLQHWGVVDRWNFAEDGMGDCEDMQLLKRKRLAKPACRAAPC